MIKYLTLVCLFTTTGGNIAYARIKSTQPAFFYDLHSTAQAMIYSDKIREWQTKAAADTVYLKQKLASYQTTSSESATEGLESKYLSVISSLLQEQIPFEKKLDNFMAWVREQMRIHFKPDGSIDYWATLVETFRSNGDDCDGLNLLIFNFFNILSPPGSSYYNAILSNVDTTKNWHMVTLYFEPNNPDPIVLDWTGAAAWGLIRLTEISNNWNPVVMFNENEIVDFTINERVLKKNIKLRTAEINSVTRKTFALIPKQDTSIEYPHYSSILVWRILNNFLNFIQSIDYPESLADRSFSGFELYITGEPCVWVKDKIRINMSSGIAEIVNCLSNRPFEETEIKALFNRGGLERLLKMFSYKALESSINFLEFLHKSSENVVAYQKVLNKRLDEWESYIYQESFFSELRLPQILRATLGVRETQVQTSESDEKRLLDATMSSTTNLDSSQKSSDAMKVMLLPPVTLLNFDSKNQLNIPLSVRVNQDENPNAKYDIAIAIDESGSAGYDAGFDVDKDGHVHEAYTETEFNNRDSLRGNVDDSVFAAETNAVGQLMSALSPDRHRLSLLRFSSTANFITKLRAFSYLDKYYLEAYQQDALKRRDWKYQVGTNISNVLSNSILELMMRDRAVALENPEGDNHKIIVLLTDGQLNGDRDIEQVLEIAQIAAQLKIRVYVYNFGIGNQSTTVMELARITRGAYIPVDSLDHLKNALANIDLKRTAQKVAIYNKTTRQFATNVQMSSYGYFTFSLAVVPGSNEIDVGYISIEGNIGKQRFTPTFNANLAADPLIPKQNTTVRRELTIRKASEVSPKRKSPPMTQ